MDPKFVNFLGKELGENVLSISSISGGDVSESFKLETRLGFYFYKLNTKPIGYEMFKKEVEGLKAIENLKCLKIPKVISTGTQDGVAFLLMEYIQEGMKSSNGMSLLGTSLAEMHLIQGETRFGWKVNNFIGELVQHNDWGDEWIGFFIENRLSAQFKLAVDKQFLEINVLPSLEKMEQLFNGIFPKVVASLIHGDLWSGNYLISSRGAPYLIDPAVYYGHFEVDLAMTEMFGGFSDQFYKAYYERNPLQPGYNERREIYQLYFYLVHLNMFGRSYFMPVMNTIRKYFK